MKKRILALLLALVTLSSLVVVASADGNECKIGATEYATFAEAVTAANAATEDVTITVLKDVTLPANQTIKNTNGKKISIVGADITVGGKTTKPTVTQEATGGNIFTLNSPVVFKDLTLVTLRGPRVATGSATFENVNITASVDVGMIVVTVADNSTEQNVTVKNCTILSEGGTGNCPCIALYTSTKVNVDVIDSTLTFKGTQTSSNNNSSVFLVSKSAAGTTDKGTVNLKGNTTLNFDPEAVPTGKVVGPIRVNTDCKGIFNVESTVTVITNNTKSTEAAKNAVISADGEAIINDNGAAWKVTKAVAAAGFLAPVFTTSYGKNVYAMALINGDEVSVITTDVVTATAKADYVTFKPLTYEASDFVLYTGASIRSDDPYGICFGGAISKTFFDQINEVGTDMEIGMIIMKKEHFERADMNLELVSAAQRLEPNRVLVTDSADGKSKEFRGCFYEITNVKQGYCAIAYITFNIGAQSYTYYTEFNAENHTRSLYDVAVSAKADTAYAGNTFIADIAAQS